MNSLDLTTNKTREAALARAARGFKVFPCLPNEKVPFSYNPEEPENINCSAKDRKLAGGIHKATTDPQRINAWFDHKLDSDFGYAGECINYGICGEDYAIIDFDVKHDAWAATEELIALGELPKTLTTRTATNGMHYIYRKVGSVGQRKLSQNIDVRSKGGYVVGPGSVINGRAYEIVDDVEPAELPEHLAKRMSRVPERDPDAVAGRAVCDLDTDSAIEAGIAWLSREEGVTDGSRGNAGFLIACQLKDLGLSPSKIHELLADHWNLKNIPPMSDERLLSIAENAHKSGRHVAGCSNPDVEFGDLPDAVAEIFPNGQAPSTYESICFADVKREPISWLWRDRFALGKINILAGQPGLGKSQLTCKFIANVTTGTRWADGDKCPRGSALMISCEDDPADTVGPRLDAAGANPAKVHMLTWVIEKDDKGRPVKKSFDIAAHVPQLRALAKRLGDVRLIVIDPISAYLGSANSHKNAEVRAAMKPLQDLAREIGAAVLLVTHLNKNSKEGSAINRVTDSGAFVAVARSAWLVAEDPDDETGQGRLLLPLKNNIGNDQEGFRFRIEDVMLSTGKTPRVVFGDIVGNADPDAVLNPDNQRASKKASAVDFLRSLLSEGPRLSDDVRLLAAEMDISESTERRACKLLGVVRRKAANAPLGPFWTMLPAHVEAFDTQTA